MTPIKHSVTRTRLFAALAGMLLSWFAADVAQSAIVFDQTSASGGGGQIVYAPTTPISGTMLASVSRFNGALGTLIQADFEFAASTTGTWRSIGNPTGTSTISLSGPADVGGQPMGNLPIGFTDTYDTINGSNSFNANSAFLTLTSGAFFNSLTGPGTITLHWIYSGNSTLSTPAVGTGPGGEGFSWGGSAHVLYTYEPIPEPSTLVLCGIGLFGVLAVARKRRKRTSGV
jgi:PEP-CTERM motif-containing protein